MKLAVYTIIRTCQFCDISSGTNANLVINPQHACARGLQ